MEYRTTRETPPEAVRINTYADFDQTLDSFEQYLERHISEIFPKSSLVRLMKFSDQKSQRLLQKQRQLRGS